MQVQSLGQEYPLDDEMATHSSILAWGIPWTEEPGWLQSMGSQRAEYDGSNLALVSETKNNNDLNKIHFHFSLLAGMVTLG